MGKITVISKAFMEKYWDDYIEKAMSHKYIRKIPNSKGGYYYVYPKDFAKPMKVLLSIFGMKEEKIDDSYKNNNIQEAYGVNKQGYAAHLLEYLSNKGAWNKFFSDKFNRDRYKTPIKTESKKTTEKTNVKESEIKNNGKTTDKTNKEHNETKEKDFKSKWNNSLMRKIYSMYNPIPEDKVTDTKQNQESGDKVSFNGKVGKITKDFGNGFVFVNFENGGMGRFKKTDLQLLNPSNQEVSNEADAKGDEIKENDPTLNTSNDTVAEVTTEYENKESVEKPGFNKVERAVITVLYNQIKKENPGLTDFGIARRIKEQYPELDAHGDVGKTMAMVKNLIWDSKITEDVATYINTKKVAEKTQEEKDREWHEKWDVRLANEFVKGKEKYLNAKPLVSNNAFIMFDKVWDSLKDKTRNEQIKGLYNMVKDDYQMSWNESLAYRKEGYSKEEVRFGYINAFLETKNPAEEHENRSKAMMGNQNARKYGNLSEEANQIIENNNLPVNADGVVQPTETELKTSKEFFEKNRNQNYKFGKDQYGNYYIQMPGVDGYYYDEKGNRVDNAAMIHQRTYHDEYIPEEPNFVTNNMNGERIYLTEEMKQIMNSGDTEYHPVDSTYVKPENDSFIDDYIDTLTKEKDINSLKARKNAMKHIYEMGKDKGIHIIPVSGIMSNTGMVTNAILPLGESDPMSDNSILVDKNNKALIDFANHIIDTVEPANTPKGQNVLLSNPEKNVLSLAYEFEKRQDPTMSDAWYIEKVTKKLPELAAKVDNWDEIKNISFGSKMFKDADAVQEIKDYAENVDKEDANNGNFGNNGNNNGNNDNNGGNDENESSNKVKKDFADFIDNFIANGYKSDKIVNVLDSTPTILQEHGIPDNPISITPNILEKVLTDESYIYHGHNLAVDVIKDLPNQLENPVYIIKGKDNKKIIVTEHYVENRPIIAVLEIDRNQGRIKVNSVRSVYDKRNDVFSEWINNPDMVEYENTEKSKVLLQSIGNQYAKEVTTPYSSNNSINSNIVNTDTSKLSEAMKGNQNAKKDFTEEQQKEYDKTKKWNEDYIADSDQEVKEELLKDQLDAVDNPDKDDRTKAKYEAIKDLYEETSGKKYEKKTVKPQTESEMKTEQKKEKEARKKAGLPNPGNNVGDRVSAIDDADTWNPNSENYRFKDTGYIAGSRKEMASMFIMERAKRGERIDAHELDFDGLEENPRAAEKLITKSNIFGEVDWDGLREKGMSGSTAFLIDRIYASAGSKPDESNAQARKQYVIALNGLRDRFEDCKTVPEVIDTLKEIREEIRGEYVEIKEMPEYKKITDRMKSLNEIMRNKRDELMDLSEQGSKTYNVERQKIIEKYIQKGKDEKKLRWNTRVSEYNIPKEYEADFSKETKGLWDKAYEPWKKAVADFKAELISRGVKEEDFFTGKKNMAGKPIEVSWYDYYTLMPEAQEYGALSSELDAYIKKMKVAVSMKNPLLEAWKSLGKRFTDILYSDSFNQHKYECTKGTYDNWEWLEKEVKVTEKKTGKEKKKFQLLVANEITRKGGRDFNLTSTQDLKKAFNLREVQSGNWVLKDPASAEFHVRNASNAFADLADVTGIGDDKISLNGRLSMAFGARGTGNAGGTTAMAHYEPVERVINLTKFKGGGCLGHEWFHAFDNMITSAMTGDNSIADVYLTNMYHGMTEANKLLLEEYVNLKDADLTYSNVYRKNQLKKQLEKKGVDVSEIDKSHKSALQIKVQNAFDDVVKAMTEGTFELMTTLNYEGKDYKNMLYNMSEDKLKRYRDYYSSYSGDRKPMQLLIADAGSLDDAVREIHKRYERYSDSKSLKNKRDWLKIAAAYYDRKPDGTKGLQPLIIPSGKTGSQFLADAKDLDNQDGRAYWSETHEMAARAFSSYIEDTLQSLGRQNDYLAYASDNKYYGGDKPYPEGEERKRINAAFKKLFEVINSEQAIQKSIEILDKFIIEKSEPRFIIKGGRFLVRK